MKGILLLNGEPYDGAIDCERAYVLCCDGAYAWAHGKIKIDENIGDFDSLSKEFTPYPPPTEIYPSEKDYTDGEIGLRKLIERGCDEIEIYGGGGGREDHFIGNLQLLYYAYARGVKVKLLTKYSEIFPASGRVELHGQKGRTMSLLPFGGSVLVTNSEGLKYPLNELKLEYGYCRGVSNVIQKDEAYFDCNAGMVLVFLDFKV